MSDQTMKEARQRYRAAMRAHDLDAMLHWAGEMALAIDEHFDALAEARGAHVVCHSWGWDDCAECQAELARRKAADECALGGGRCLTHGVADTPDHHFEQPRYQGKTD